MKVKVVGVSVKVFISNVKALLLLCIIAVHNTVKLSECNLIVAYFPVCISLSDAQPCLTLTHFLKDPIKHDLNMICFKCIDG